jgi:tRNA dimethylallyltransferase
VPHHLLDMVNASDDRFTAGRFVQAAFKCIDDVASRGKVPVICGGTMLYLRWLVHGVPENPPSDQAVALKV